MTVVSTVQHFSKQRNKQAILICCQLPVCTSLSAGRKLLITILETLESDCQSASSSAVGKFTRNMIKSIAPDILRIFSQQSCRDRNVQNSDVHQEGLCRMILIARRIDALAEVQPNLK